MVFFLLVVSLVLKFSIVSDLEFLEDSLLFDLLRGIILEFLKVVWRGDIEGMMEERMNVLM